MLDIFKDGHVTLYSYNLSGQLTKVTDALGQEETYEYDQYGRLKTKTDRDNYATNYKYNDLGVVTEVGYADGRSVEFSYNELNQLNEINDWLGKTTLENDILGRLTKVTDYQNRTVGYEYNSIGEKTKLTYPDGRVASYSYDEEGKLSAVVGNGEETSYSYDEFGRLVNKSFANGVMQEYSYLPGGNLHSMESHDKEGVLDKYFYTYDNTGLISGINRKRRGLDAVSGQYDYKYDAIGRLTESSLNGQVKSAYEYDAFGNRTVLTEKDTTTAYKYDVLDRLVEAKELNNSQAIVKTYDYDKRGNQTKEFVDGLLQKTFTFDATNMLSKVVDSNKGEVENKYNGLGFRVTSTRPEEKIEYLCDLSRDYYNLLERTVNGETESFVYDNNVVSMSKSGNNYYYLQDELGSPMYMTGTDGVAVSSYAFDDFGRNVDPFTGKIKEYKLGYTTDGNIIQPFAFTGYQEDEVSGLKFAQARFYDASAGRFQSEDNVKGFITAPFTLNHYGYCWENPVGLVDIDGNIPVWLEGVLAHRAIELDIQAEYSKYGYNVQTNVFIPGGGAGRTKTGNGLADIVMKSGSEYSVYEIKPSSQDTGGYDMNNLTPGQAQLEGYINGINMNISTGGTLGKYGSTSIGERAVRGIESPCGVVYMGNATINYYSNGDGMIYYEIDKTKKKETQHAYVKGKETAWDKTKEFFINAGETLWDFGGKLADGFCTVGARMGKSVFGLGEIIGGSLCYLLGGALVLDDVSGVGVLDDGVAAGSFVAGTYLIWDGTRKLTESMTGCGLE